MKQLCELTGMTRQAIHFYIKKGLVPPPIKHTRTSAEYTDEHLQRILLVRRMQEEQFLPLDVIKATLDERDEGFTPAQKRVLSSVRSRFAARAVNRDRQPTLHLTTVAQRTGVAEAEIRAFIETGLVGGERDDKHQWRVARDDVWVLELWAELSELGFGSANGFRPEDMKLYTRLIDELVRQEAELMLDRLSGEDPDQLSGMIERALPLLSTLVSRLHDRAVRRFVDAL